MGESTEPEARSEHFWLARARWRLRGAPLWPAFLALTVADALILHLLPPLREGVDLPPALIVASFANLFLVAMIAPWLARRLTAHRAGEAGAAPYEVTLDRTAVALLACGAAGLVAAGLAARPLVVVETEARERASAAVADWVGVHGTAEVRANLDAANTIRLDEDYFRVCIPLNDRTRAACLFVDTHADRARVRRDRDTRPNQLYVR